MMKVVLVLLAQLSLGLCVLCPDAGYGDCCNGRSWSDFNDYDSNGNMTGIRVWFDEFINGIQARYGEGSNAQWADVRGTEVGAKNETIFEDDEYVISVTVRSGKLLDQLTFNTYLHSYGPYGGWGGTTQEAEAGTHLAYLSGRDGGKIDQLNFYFGNC